MSYLNDLFNENAVQQDSGPSIPSDQIFGPPEHGDFIAVMVLDGAGRIRYCDSEAAQLFRASRSALMDRHVKERIPDLPFRLRTPGYNVAYATFWSPWGPPRAFCGLDIQGRSFDVQVALDPMLLGKRHQILVRLRLLQKSNQARNDADMRVEALETPTVTE